ncbi:acyl-CoA synthetase [Nocardia sp. CNY236]|uniref:acyl-CoA synthetase n=1 Tax=Nocardia sp. CNY236 TaxID=1169152 RepID=UPI00048F6F63|nr:acyl-CoA synthetase [Nocardia sp. CNY236]
MRLAHQWEIVRALLLLRKKGVISLTLPWETLRQIKDAKLLGPQASTISRSARKAPDAPALVDERGTLTYRELDEQSNAIARGLRAAGIAQGMVIGLLARDHRGLILSMAAAGKLGVRLVLMNTGFAKPQFAEVCAREQVKAVLHDSEFLGLLDALPADLLRYLTWVDDDAELSRDEQTLDDLIANNSSEALPRPKSPGGFVILTSGTTGTPKGAARNKLSPLAIAQIVDRIPFPRRGTQMVVSPIFHSTGLATWVVASSLASKVVVVRRFDAETTLKLIADHKVEMLVAVPTMVHRMVELDPAILAKYDTSSLRVLLMAGSALPPDLVIKTTEVFGPVVYNLYGSTECAVATVADPRDSALAPGTAGRAPITCEVRLYDNNDQRVTAIETPARIFIRSGSPFEGYTDGRTKQVIDGYMSSGDVGHFDAHGLLMVDGRDDDMIVSGGENVFPQEVENLLLERSDIFDAAVVGVDDAEFGKRLRAFVVPEPGHTPDGEEIKTYVKKNLARYKVPREVIVIDDLPRNATGKLVRRALVNHDVQTSVAEE